MLKRPGKKLITTEDNLEEQPNNNMAFVEKKPTKSESGQVFNALASSFMYAMCSIGNYLYFVY